MRRLKVKELAEQRGLTQSKLMRMADLNMKTVQGLYTAVGKSLEPSDMLKGEYESK